jgi:hypothetical protein
MNDSAPIHPALETGSACSKLPLNAGAADPYVAWLAKSMMAFTMRIEQAISDMRPATPRSSKVKSTASTRASNGRARRQALRQEPLGRHCRGKAHPIHSVSRRDPDRLNAKLFKKRLGGRMQSDPCADGSR